jgi:hypothetical protein
VYGKWDHGSGFLGAGARVFFFSILILILILVLADGDTYGNTKFRPAWP